ncbi:MAG: sigma-E processing peptidase SpoIIGA [Clostridia bacterium]|nr:sigma-E processing peptidase SpoIIGA [Clostridia bacterium]
MEVYIEDVIIDNFIIDLIILYITAKLLKINYKKILIIISAMIGASFTILSLYINLNPSLLLLYKLLTAVTMLLIAYNFKSIKQFILNFLTFLLVTALMGGFCFLICFSFGEVILINGNVYYEIFLPMGIIMGCVFLISYFLFKIFEVIKYKAYNSNFIYNATLSDNEKSVSSLAFVDTGNTLSDPLTGKPVNIITFKVFQKLFREVPIHQILLKKIPNNLKRVHYIKVSSVGEKSEMLIFYIESLKISQRNFTLILKNSCLGLTFANLEKKLSCGLLLNPQTLNENI